MSRRLVVLAGAGALLSTTLQCGPGTHRDLSQVGPGTHEFTFRFEGRRRSYRLHVPRLPDGTRAPLVLSFHGRFADGEDQAELSHLDAVADEHGFVVVYPDGVGKSWNTGSGAGPAQRRGVDDVAFVSALIDRVSQQVALDRKRVYATGMSNGGNFTHRLGCERSDRISAIAAVAGTMPARVAQDCHPQRPVSMLQVHGTADHFNPFDGGRTAGGGQVVSVRDTAGEWIRRDGCGPDPVTTRVAQDATRASWTGCTPGTEVDVIRVEGGGHGWPGGGEYLPPRVVGQTTQTFDASELIWKFFSEHGGTACTSC